MYMRETITEDLTQLTDAELQDLNTSQAQDILARRTRGATLLRLVLARIFNRDNAATRACQWIVPHLTPQGTIGILDVSRGIALDSRVQATEDILALGLSDEHTSEYNYPPSTTDDPRALGESREPAEPGDGEVVDAPADSMGADLLTALMSQWENPAHPITAPEGWRRINLPVSRGYEGDERCKVPPHEYADNQRITPWLVGIGFITHSGNPGPVTRLLKPQYDENITVSHLPLTPLQRERLSQVGKSHLRTMIAEVGKLKAKSAMALADATPGAAAQKAALRSNEEIIAARVSKNAKQVPMEPIAAKLAEDTYGAQWAVNLGGDEESKQLLEELKTCLHQTVLFETCCVREAILQFIQHLYIVTARTKDDEDTYRDAFCVETNDERDRSRAVLDHLVEICLSRIFWNMPVDRKTLTPQVNAAVMQEGPLLLGIKMGSGAPEPRYQNGAW